MHETLITVTGNLVADPELRVTTRGDHFATFRLACTERRRDSSGAWGDGHTNYVRVTAFRSLAQNVRGSLEKGMRVIVTGRLRVSEWQSEERRGTSVEIDAHAVGPDLSFAYADVTRGVWCDAQDPMADAAVRDAASQDGVPATAGYGGALPSSGPLLPPTPDHRPSGADDDHVGRDDLDDELEGEDYDGFSESVGAEADDRALAGV